MDREGGVARLQLIAPREPLDERQGPQGVSSLWELFFAHSSFAAYRDTTQVNFRRTAALTAQLRLGERPTPGDVQIWISRLRALPGKRGRKMAATTVGLHRDNLHAMFVWAQHSGKGWTSQLGNPVAASLCPFKREAPMRRALRAVDDVWPFLLAAGGDGGTPWSARERGFLAVLRYLGLRRSEALALTRGQVTNVDGVMHVSVIAQRQPDDWSVGPTKTPRSVRTLPCRPELAALLARVVKLPDPTVRCGLGGGDSRQVPFLFPFQEAHLKDLIARLRGVSPDDFPGGDAWHVFRHTVAVELSQRGAPVESISEWLGHVDISHTQTYLRTLTGKRVSSAMLNYFAEETSRGDHGANGRSGGEQSQRGAGAGGLSSLAGRGDVREAARAEVVRVERGRAAADVGSQLLPGVGTGRGGAPPQQEKRRSDASTSPRRTSGPRRSTK